MAENKVDPVDRVLDSVDAFGSKIDELANKVVALVGKMGPEAKVVFDETLQAYALGGLLTLLVMVLTALLGIGFGVWAMFKGEAMLKQIEVTNKASKYEDRVGDDGPGFLIILGIVSLVVGMVSSVVMVFIGADLFVRWMHPLGSLILEKL